MTRPSRTVFAAGGAGGGGMCARERAGVWGGRGVVEPYLSNSYPHALLSLPPWRCLEERFEAPAGPRGGRGVERQRGRAGLGVL